MKPCRKNTENINPRVSKTSNGRTMVLSKCAIWGSKKSRFIKMIYWNGSKKIGLKHGIKGTNVKSS